MRPPRPRIHLLDLDEPLLAFRDLVCRCQAVLKNAQPEFMAVNPELTFELMELLALRLCTECRKREPVGADKRRYCYGLVEGQEERNFEEN